MDKIFLIVLIIVMIYVYLLIFLRINFFDEEWFGYEIVGIFVVGWEGGLVKFVEFRGGKRLEDEEEVELVRFYIFRLDFLDLAEYESRSKITVIGIEIVVVLVIGIECLLVNFWRRLIYICN